MRSELPFEPAEPAWEVTTLGEICASGGGGVQTGPFGSQLHAADYMDSGVPVIMPQDLVDGQIDSATVARVGEDDAERLSRHRVEPGDIVYSRRGDIRRRALIKRGQAGWLCGTGCLRVRLGNGSRPDYVAAYLGHPAVQDWIERHAVGATMLNLNTKILEAVPVLLPPIDEQERIASVLGALDDRIDSNRRLARLLEQIAEAEFQARFVDLIGLDRLVDSALGPLPEGWRVGTLADLADLHKDQVKPAETPDALFEHFSIPAFDTENGPLIEPGRAILSAKTSIPGPECVLVSKLNPGTKRVWWPRPRDADAAVCSPEFLVLMPRAEIPTSYLYAVTSSDDRFYRQLLSHVSGTTGSRQRVKPGAAMSCPVTLPASEALDRWEYVSRPLYDHAHSLIAESRHLGEIREMLLPKLVSGQIRIPDTSNPGEVTDPLVDEAA